MYATCENKPDDGGTKKSPSSGVAPGLQGVNIKNPKEMVDLMGKKMFKNIAEEFFKNDNLLDSGVEVTLFDSDIIVLSDDSMGLLGKHAKKPQDGEREEEEKVT